MKRQISRLATLLAVVAAMAAMSAPALADPPPESGVVVRANAITGGFFYFGDGYVVLTGTDEFINGCTGENFVERTIVTTMPGNGSSQERISHHDEPLLVFEADVSSIPEFFAWSAAGCAAPPEPIATGTGRLDSHVNVSANGDVRSHNGVVARVTTSDGRDVHLRTFVKLTVKAGNLKIQQLTVDYGG